MNKDGDLKMSTATFSNDRIYRYDLCRTLGDGNKTISFIGLNPSTADEINDDPTVRRCIGFAQLWGYDIMYMLNIFSYRATDPKDMKTHYEPIGPENDLYLCIRAQISDMVICAWGNHGVYLDRGAQVKKLLQNHNIDLYHLGLTKMNYPKHPLYLKSSTEPALWK